LFPNGDSNLHNVLSEEKVTKNTKTLNNFDVDEIKMVNGTRRNLNLKLSSPHNLRTRAKHESGHLLRSKGSPRHEIDKSDKLYNNKFEGFTIKKRSKGTIWIEEDEPDEKYTEDILKEAKQEDFKIKSFSKHIDEVYNKEDGVNNINPDPTSLQPTILHNNMQNGIVNSCHILENPVCLKKKDECNSDTNTGTFECNRIKENGVVDDSYIDSCKSYKDTFQRDNCALQIEKMTVTDVNKILDENDANTRIANEVVCNGYNSNKSEQEDLKVPQGENARCVKLRYARANRRGRGIRGRYRHRLSVEERLIEDNRAYYKVEVLGNKLRSSAVPSGNSQQVALKDGDEEEKKETPSSEKPVVVRFKRVRKSELSLLSDEAESFMFGEPKRDDSSEHTSDDEQSSVLPRDTDSSEIDKIANSSILSSSSLDSSPVKQEIIEEDSQDSVHLGRIRKRRRTQAEAFIKDNTDYYKFETPGSRLRYQAPLTGIKDIAVDDSEHIRKSMQELIQEGKPQTDNDIVEKIYPSKPSAEIERMQFSFEAIPKSEPWYQTYQRQDMGAEFWHCFSECDAGKPFLLPYEIENFHETLMRHPGRIEPGRKRGRGRGIGCVGRSPRKSPRCHASTLAIMSTIIRKREQQQSSNLCVIQESLPIRLCTDTSKLEQKQAPRSDVDEELKEMAKTIDEMLSTKGIPELDDSFEPDLDAQIDGFCETNIPKGAPPNLLELLDNCHEMVNCLENNSSCANSECGEVNMDTPLRRRKRRKNRTGWPVDNKMKKKIQANSRTLTDCDRGESLIGKTLYSNEDFTEQHVLDASDRLLQTTDLHVVTISNNNVTLSTAAERLSINQKNDADALLETCTTMPHNICHEALTKGDKNMELVNNDNMNNYVESSISENMCNDTMNKNYISGKDYPCRKDLLDIEEFSENDPGNDENHENQNLFSRKDVAITDRTFVAKSPVRKQRQREHVTVAATDDDCESRDTEIENQDNLQLQCRKDTESSIVPKKHHNSNSELSPKRQLRGDNCEENPSSDTGELLKAHHHGIVFTTTRRGRIGSRRRVYSRKRSSRTAVVAHGDLSSSNHVVYDDENCKKDAYLSITSCNKKQLPGTGGIRGVKRKNEAISSSDNIQELSEPMDQCALAERVSPPVISSSELKQRRSSIEFQPVVRMMKLDDQVDMDHSILSTVTVASNRRLRSSGGSPRSHTQQPKKRVKSSRGHFGRWLKSS